MNEYLIITVVFIVGVAIGWGTAILRHRNRLYNEMRQRFIKQRDRVTDTLNKAFDRMDD